MDQEISLAVAVFIVGYVASTSQNPRAGASVVKMANNIHGAVYGTVV